jgi:hypothetical protein
MNMDILGHKPRTSMHDCAYTCDVFSGAAPLSGTPNDQRVVEIIVVSDLNGVRLQCACVNEGNR